MRHKLCIFVVKSLSVLWENGQRRKKDLCFFPSSLLLLANQIWKMANTIVVKNVNLWTAIFEFALKRLPVSSWLSHLRGWCTLESNSNFNKTVSRNMQLVVKSMQNHHGPLAKLFHHIVFLLAVFCRFAFSDLTSLFCLHHFQLTQSLQ